MSAYATMMPEVQEQSVSAPLPLSTPRSALTRDDVMTAREVSDFLKLPVSTVYELARRGEIPARRLGRTWRFLRSRLEELLAT
jgi:excisionase family DNA binding protein